MMMGYKVEKVGEEWHVLQLHPMDPPDNHFIFARCTGPVPAYDIMAAMRLAGYIEDASSNFHNTVGLINSAQQRFKNDIEDGKRMEAYVTQQERKDE